MSDQWPRAHLRAALREAGYDAVGTRDLDNALRIAPAMPGRGPVELLVVDQHVLHADAPALLQEVRDRFGHPRSLLVASAMSERATDEWDRVVSRPLTVAQLVSAVQSALPLERRRPID